MGGANIRIYTEGSEGNEGIFELPVLVLLAWLRGAVGHDGGAVLKKRIWLGLIAGVALAGMLVLLCDWQPEPQYDGKPLSYWVDTNGCAFRSRRHIDTRNANHAIRTIGTNGLPFLLKWIRYETPPWKRKLYDAVNPMLLRLNPSWKLNDETSSSRGKDALLAIYVLGPSAEAIVCELAKTLNDPTRQESARRARRALSGIGAAGLPSLLQCLTNPSVKVELREGVISAIAGMGSPARAAFPVLYGLLSDSDSRLRLGARNALEQIDSLPIRRIERGE